MHDPQIKIDVWRPGTDDRWHSVLERTNQSHLAHQPQWGEAFASAYGHEPLYFIAEDGMKNRAVLPAFVLDRPLLGTVVASMPFLDGGGPCGSSDALKIKLLESLHQKATELDAKWIELRSTEPLPLETPPHEDKVTLVFDLPADTNVLWKNLKAKVRNLVRKGDRAGLTVEWGGSELLDAFYPIFAINMRDLGSPVHSRAFFAETLKAFGDQAHIALIKKDETAVGGLIGIGYQETFAVPWASSLREYFKLSPNMLLYWQALQRACTQGYRRFDFGRSSRDVGTYRFKKQWGAEEQQLYWYRLPVADDGSMSANGASATGSLAVDVWKKLPVGVATWLGPKVRKYLTQ